MRILKDIVADFLNTDYARKECNNEFICDLIAEMDEHVGSHESKDTERDACDDCPYYDVQFEICNSPIGCLNEGVTE